MCGINKINLPRKLDQRFHLALRSQTLSWNKTRATVKALWHKNCYFRDPMINTHNRDEFINHLSMMDRFGQIENVDIIKSQFHEDTGMAFGTLKYKFNNGPKMIVDFSTYMVFQDGLIVEHRDYWDILQALSSLRL